LLKVDIPVKNFNIQRCSFWFKVAHYWGWISTKNMGK